MIIGRDLMCKLGLITDFKNNTLIWEDTSRPMRTSQEETGNPQFRKHELKEIIKQTAEPIATQQATEGAVKILDSTYEKANLEDIAANAANLDKEEKELLLTFLKDFEELFDGTLGHWDTEPVNIELKADAKPVNSRYYPVQKINKETFKKELLCLVDIGVLTPVQSSA